MQFEKIGFTDIDGVFRGKFVNPESIVLDDAIKFCDVIFGWDVNDKCYQKDSVTGWGTGFPDGKLKVDKSLEITIPWENSTKLHLSDFSEDKKLKKVCPRSLLKQILSEYQKLGFHPRMGFEYEWYNFKNDAQYENLDEATITKRNHGYSLLKLSENQNYISSLLGQLSTFQIPLEGLHTETGPGVLETAIKHDYVLNAADFAILFKYATKSIAKQHGIDACFMAKWSENYPGSGGHIHISLLNKQYDDIIDFKNKQPTEITAQFMAGILTGLPVLFPLFAPFINSYKRFSSNHWTPLNFTWGFQNRTTMIRVIKNLKDQYHLELRVPGADANPYLVAYATLAAGLYGIKNKLSLNKVATIGNAYLDKKATPIPKTLEKAVFQMKNSPLTNQIIDETFAKHYIITREHEIKEHHKHISQWELDRYLILS